MLYSQDFIESSKSIIPNNISGGGEEGLKQNGTTKEDCKVDGKLLRKVNSPSTALCPPRNNIRHYQLESSVPKPQKMAYLATSLGFEQYLSHMLPLSIGKHKWVFRSEGQKGNVLPSGNVQAL